MKNNSATFYFILAVVLVLAIFLKIPKKSSTVESLKIIKKKKLPTQKVINKTLSSTTILEPSRDKIFSNKGSASGTEITKFYRNEASFTPVNYVYSILAGSVVSGNRNGVGLYAQFRNPSDIVFGLNNQDIYLLDKGNSQIKKILLKTSEVITFFDFQKYFKNSVSKLPFSGFSKIRWNNGSFYLVEGNGQGLWVLKNKKLK